MAIAGKQKMFPMEKNAHKGEVMTETKTIKHGKTRTKDFVTFNFLIRRQFTLLFLSVMLVKERSLLYR